MRGNHCAGESPQAILLPVTETLVTRHVVPLGIIHSIPYLLWGVVSGFAYILFMRLFQNDAHHGNNCIVLGIPNLHQTPPFVWAFVRISESEFTMSGAWPGFVRGLSAQGIEL